MTSIVSFTCLMWLPVLAADQPAPATDLTADETVVFGQLANGLEYAVMPNAEPPGKASVRLLVKAGSLQESDEQQGVAHFLEHMAFNGSEHYPPGELIEYLQRIGMSFGADTNAHTSFDETVYKLELPATDEAMLREGMQVMADYAGGLLLREEEIESERGVILSELRDRDTVDYRTFVAYWEFLFPDSLIPQRLPIGKTEVIKFADRDVFVNFYGTWYRPDNMALVIVGDLDPAAVVPLVEEYFGQLKAPSGAITEPDLGVVTSAPLRTHLHSEPEATATEIGILSVTAFDNLPDSREVRIEAIRMATANRILSRRLEKLAKLPDAPFSEGSAYNFDYLDFFELSGIEITCRPEQWVQALAVGEQELRRALEFGFSEAEVEEAKANLIAGYELALEQAPTRKHRALSGALSDAFAGDDVFTSPELDLKLAREAMEDFDAELAHSTLQQMWSDEGRAVFVTGNLTLGQDDPSIEQAYADSAAVEVFAPEAADAIEWPYADWGMPGKLATEQHVEDLDVWQARFENNVRFNFKQTDFEAGSVQVLISFGGGQLSEPADKPGLGLFASMVFSSGGTDQLSEDELKQVLAGKVAGADFSVEEDVFVMAGATTPEDLKITLELMTAYLSEPGYREEAARLARKYYAELDLRMTQTLEGVMGNRVSRYLASDSRFFGYPDMETFSAFTMHEVEAWLNAPLSESYLEIAIVGDVPYEMAKALVAETLGTLPERAAQPEPFAAERASVRYPKVEAGAPAKVFTYETNLPRAAAYVSWPTTDYWDIQRTRRLSILSQVLADRMRLEVREKLGEGYSPYARNDSSEVFKDYGYLYALNLCKPESTEDVAKLITELGADLGTGNVTQDELDRALKPVLNMLKDYVRNNSYWLSRVLGQSQQYPQSLDWARTIQSDYASITVEEINAVAKEYLGNKAGLSIIVKPASE